MNKRKLITITLLTVFTLMFQTYGLSVENNQTQVNKVLVTDCQCANNDNHASGQVESDVIIDRMKREFKTYG